MEPQGKEEGRGMTGQMSIFDYMQPEKIALEDLPEEDMIHMLENATGINFKKVVFTSRYYPDVYEYEYKRGQLRIAVKYENYDLEDNHDRFIDVMCSLKFHSMGFGGPCDTIDEAVKYIRKGLDTLNQIAQKQL